jgi:hypothetical protein
MFGECNTEDRCARGGRGDPCTQWSIPNQAQNPEDGILLSAFLRDLGFLRLLYMTPRAAILIVRSFAARRNLTPNPFPCGKGDNRVGFAVWEKWALLTPVVGTSVEILRVAQDDTKIRRRILRSGCLRD